MFFEKNNLLRLRTYFGAKIETGLTIFAIFEFSCQTSSGNGVGRPFSLCTLVNPVCLSDSQLPNLLIVPFLNRICGFNFRRGKVQKTKLKYQSENCMSIPKSDFLNKWKWFWSEQQQLSIHANFDFLKKKKEATIVSIGKFPIQNALIMMMTLQTKQHVAEHMYVS